MSFDALGLAPELLRAVADEGYTEPTPVQREAIPLVLARRDLLAGAQTGTGKTAAFVLPIIQILHETRVAPPAAAPAHVSPALNQRGRFNPSQQASRSTPATSRPPIRVLAIVPTRELCIQVEESVRTYGARRPIKSTTIYGGVGFEPQAARLRGGPEIVVATPGRLLDHVSQRTIDLSRVEILVLDEADRLLDMGFIRDIRRIIDLLPPKRQNLLFSATFSDDVRQLASGILVNPGFVQVTPRNTTAELVEQLVIPVDRERKRDLLRELVALGRIDQALVFTRTKHGANRLAEQLVKDGINASAIHGNKSQSQRVKALTDFKEGRVAILVATDIAARGLDIEQLPHVVNYELPMVPEDYIHRIGRTGRAGTDGQAISLVCVDEAPLLRDIQSLLRRTIPSEVIAGFEPDRSVRAEPIRLRSTPAERAMHAAARGGSGRGGVRADRGGATQNRGGAGSRGPAPARHAGAGSGSASGGSFEAPGTRGSGGSGSSFGNQGGSPSRGGGSGPSRGGGSGPSRGRRRPDGRGTGASIPGSSIGRVVPGTGSSHRGDARHGSGGGHTSGGSHGGHTSGGHGSVGARALPGERIRHLEPRG
jgi:ATP-dependent RNA helicase RhlE